MVGHLPYASNYTPPLNNLETRPIALYTSDVAQWFTHKTPEEDRLLEAKHYINSRPIGYENSPKALRFPAVSGGFLAQTGFDGMIINDGIAYIF